MLMLFAAALRRVLLARAVLVAENLALRQQLAVLRDRSPRARLKPRDRAFWVTFAWRGSVGGMPLILVKPATAFRWHREGFRWYWRWKSRPGRVGRPRAQAELRKQCS